MLHKYNKVISESPKEKRFFTAGGELKSLYELKDALEKNKEPFYNEYVKDGQNHFANWVEHVFEDSSLAAAMRESKSHKEAAKAVADKITFAELWISYNAKKESLNSYLLSNMPGKISYPDFSPEHHKFETLIDYNNSIVPMPLQPGTGTIRPKDELGILKNSAGVAEPPKIAKASLEKDEKQLLKDLEEQFPGLKIAKEPPKQKGFLKGILKPFGK